MNIANDVLLRKAKVYMRLAFLGIDPDANLQAGLSAVDERLERLKSDPLAYAAAHIERADVLAGAFICSSQKQKKSDFFIQAILGYMTGAGELDEEHPLYLEAVCNLQFLFKSLMCNAGMISNDAPQLVQDCLDWVNWMGLRMKTNPSSASQFLSLEGSCRLSLASWGIDRQENLRLALNIRIQQLEATLPETLEWATQKALLADVLAQMDRVEEAYNHLEQSLNLVERTRAQVGQNQDRLGFLAAAASSTSRLSMRARPSAL